MDGRTARAGAETKYLARTMILAARARGRTSPNPMVGAVVVAGGRVVGEGWHTRPGAPHAEVVALERAGARARGARLYVNLEPCCHHGRTPPCTDAILAAGVTEVVACMRDPDRRVNGRGFRALRAAGVRVRVGAMRREAERLNEAFLRWQRSATPFVTLKAGMTIDGRIATPSGESRWITSAAARAAARRLRARHDAVLVGVGTVLADDPGLCGGRPRRVGERTMAATADCGPARVVLDSRLRTPPGARLFRAAGGPVLVMTAPGAPAARRRRLERAGAVVIEVRGRAAGVDLGAALRELGRRGLANVLIEGGGEVLGSALDAGIGDRVALFVAPRLLGGRGARPAFGGRGPGQLAESTEVRRPRLRRVGGDWLVEGTLVHRRRRRATMGERRAGARRAH
jgi:diaminohydroxyphosphoribosylaminopyrimidine deaminase / 5-amino-6-(5-phosphoribosylamino)uracil reductase